MSEVVQIILGSSIVTSLVTGVIAYFFHKRTERINAEIRQEYEIKGQLRDAHFEWQKKTAELLGQTYILLNRSRNAYLNKYSKLAEYNQFYEDEIIYTTNKQIRDLLLENGHHIPPELLDDVSKIIEHYDVWLDKYNTLRKKNNDHSTKQVYVGPDGFRFPEDAEEKFKQKYIELFNKITSIPGLDQAHPPRT